MPNKSSDSQKSLPKIEGAKVAILQSRWYKEYTDKMLGCCAELLRKAGALEPEVHVLPGSMEIPFAARTLAAKGGYDAFIFLGAVVKGETYHFEMIINSVSQGALQVGLEYGVPCIMEILPCTALDQLIRRSGNDEFNRGIEAAVNAIEMIRWKRENG